MEDLEGSGACHVTMQYTDICSQYPSSIANGPEMQLTLCNPRHDADQLLVQASLPAYSHVYVANNEHPRILGTSARHAVPNHISPTFCPVAQALRRPPSVAIGRPASSSLPEALSKLTTTQRTSGQITIEPASAPARICA